MANYAFSKYTSVANQTNFAFSFESMETADVKVSLDDINTPDFSIDNYTTSGGGTVVLSTAPDVGTEVIVYRDTSITSMDNTFVNASAIKADDLNENFTQLRNAIQENTADIDEINDAEFITSVTAGVGLSGGGTSGDVTIDLEDTTVTPGSYTHASITVDQQGRITAAANGTGGGGVTKIIAGTNVTISPNTGIGDVTINAEDGGIPDAPADGNQYAREDNAWSVVNSGIPEAPIDGKTYGRNDAAWVEVINTGGGITYKGTIDCTLPAPSNPEDGDFYVNIGTGTIDASWTGIEGTDVVGGERVAFNGSTWEMLPSGPNVLNWTRDQGNLYPTILTDNVGIGTTSPDEKLHIAAGENSAIRLGQAGGDFAYRLRANVSSSVNGGFLIQDAVSGNDLYQTISGPSGSHRFFIDNSEKVRIDTAGRVGIKTKTPNNSLHVVGDFFYGIRSQSLPFQGTDTNKAFSASNSDLTDTFNVSYRGQGYFARSVGIGTADPQTELEVSGTVRATVFDLESLPELP